ncbi:MAG: hypothetical protein P1U53_18445 [Sulfitobacter sp.]|nr:hypothetical protein [Sulfitobacter sp.]
MESCFPKPFGLANTNAICHFNALLQALASCPKLIAALCRHREHFLKTATGARLCDFALAVRQSCAQGAAIDPSHSARLLEAFLRDLRARRPGIRYAGSNESASEGFVLLLDVIGFDDSPAADLLRYRAGTHLWCKRCCANKFTREPGAKVGVVSSKEDRGFCFNAFHLDESRFEFPMSLLLHSSRVDGYRCDVCKGVGEAHSVCTVDYLPEVFVVALNQYRRKKLRKVGDTFRAKGARYVLVATVEHSGGLGGGHYRARCTRANGGCIADDLSLARGEVAVTANTYLAFFEKLK